MSLDEPGRIEEERRLAYVGMTRAMRQLYLTYAETRRLYGTDSYNRPSRFLLEVPREYIQEVRISGDISHPLSSRNSFSDDSGALRIGQRVSHDKFGEGIVMQSEGDGDRARVQINFKSGAKWLMLGYANLQQLD